MATTEPEPTAADLRAADDIIDAVRAKVQGDDTAAALLAIPHLREDPITTGSFLLSLLEHVITSYAAHCREHPSHTVDRLWHKPAGAR